MYGINYRECPALKTINNYEIEMAEFNVLFLFFEFNSLLCYISDIK